MSALSMPTIKVDPLDYLDCVKDVPSLANKYLALALHSLLDRDCEFENRKFKVTFTQQEIDDGTADEILSATSDWLAENGFEHKGKMLVAEPDETLDIGSLSAFFHYDHSIQAVKSSLALTAENLSKAMHIASWHELGRK